MSKRSRTSGGSLTGGTGDIKPQIFTLSTGTQGATDDYVTDRIPLPVPRIGTMKTKATIFEILWVDWYLSPEGSRVVPITQWAFLSTVTTRSDGDASTLATLAEDLNDPRSFAVAVLMSADDTSGGGFFTMPKHIDLTDDNGNGILVATDQIVITGGSLSATAAGQFICKVGYRLVNVGITEYVGIVQSQQI